MHHADKMQGFLSSQQPELVQSLVVRLELFAIASGQRIDIAKSCVVPLGTMPPPPATEAARVGPLTVVASVGLRNPSRQPASQPASGHPP
jgi:hypothetical protein